MNFAELKQKAEQGDAWAMFELGERYLKGEGVQRSSVYALFWWKKVVERESGVVAIKACQSLAKYWEEFGNKKEAKKWLEKAGSYNNSILETNDRVEYHETSLDYDKGVAYFAGETHAIFNPSGIQDYKMALDFFVKATTSEKDPASIAEAWNYIGVIYQNGLGVDEDKEKAFVAFESSAANGSYRGAEHLALKYYMGDGVEKDVARAMEIFRTAWGGGYFSPEFVGLVEAEAEKGNKDAQWCLRECFANLGNPQKQSCVNDANAGNNGGCMGMLLALITLSSSLLVALVAFVL